ncbi:hypothetical protein LVD17_13860 [Fulvivirga ulvae]|uniref:hypothetical protein n=1 Tax=Fulvivirga ulvae TaxID=2904245 RepID=UPI001F18ADAB|nr:hypothetical protein [Fulvivirga ulvae]UII34893.1 hypothetical protein LVD17_13860 [Fulvivirga ulvae]
MRFFIALLLLFLISSSVVYAQREDSSASDSVDHHHYLVYFDPNPNDFVNKNLRKYFTKNERKKLRDARLISVNAVIDIEEHAIIRLYSSDSVKVNDQLMEKLINIIANNITVSPKKLPFQVEDKKYMERVFYLTTHNY